MSPAVSLDLRQLAPQERHLRVFSSFDALAPDATLELVNDHDPLPLQRQFHALVPNLFTWNAVESGPEAWRVHITKLARRDHCCGGCCGG
jgi:uncharacterized protein (DUF2249 family)